MINVPYEDMPREIEALLGEIEQLEQENQQLRYYKFYKYENNPNGSDYCFCQRPCESNMSLRCFLENGEILGFMSETLVINYPEIKEIDLNEFIHQFVKPLIKENQQLKEEISEVRHSNQMLLWAKERADRNDYESTMILDEIREYINTHTWADLTFKLYLTEKEVDEIKQILDKVRE